MRLASSAASADSHVVGDAVSTASGEELGRIVGFVRDSRHGTFAVLAAGGVLGIADRFFVVPLQAFRVEEDHHLVLDMPRWRLREAPGYARGEQPPVEDAEWVGDLHRFYGVARH